MPWYENSGGERLWYEDAGAGCPVVLLHGWCMSSTVWKYQYEELAASRRIIAPDLRGHGLSRGVTGYLDFDRFAADLIDLFDRLDLSRVVLAGWSMGAQIALHAYAGLSDRLAGLVLVSATPRFTATDDFPHALAVKEAGGMRLKVQRNAQRALEGFYTRLFAEGELEHTPHAAAIEQLLAAIPVPDTSAVLDALDALARVDMRHILAKITTPVLIMNGAHDRICLPEASRFLKEHISGARQVIFPGCGHAPFLTHSRQFNAELTTFARSTCEQNV